MGNCSSKTFVVECVDTPQPCHRGARDAWLFDSEVVCTGGNGKSGAGDVDFKIHPLEAPRKAAGSSAKDSMKIPGAMEAFSTFPLNCRTTRRFGWKPDLPDIRDRVLDVQSHSKVAGADLPSAVDLRPQEDFPVYDQGHLGSCTANAIAAAFEFEQKRQGLKAFSPSRLFIYYNERVMEDSVSDDSGAMIRDGITSLNKIGVCDEATWPYDISKFAEKPTFECYQAAGSNTCKEYARVEQTLESLKGCIAAGYPFVFGFAVFTDIYSFEVQTKGVMRFPPTGQCLGGHAVQACGYDDARGAFIVRNSWGPDWGDQGHFYMPYRYITHPQLCSDFWAINFVEGAEFPVKAPRIPRAVCASEEELVHLPRFVVPEAGVSIPVRSAEGFGWRKDLPDIRDRVLDVRAFKRVAAGDLPPKVDLRPGEDFPLFNQGRLGSCTANALAAAYEFEQKRQNIPDFTPSRLFIYYNERVMEGSVFFDSGAYLRDGIQVLSKLGVCDEALWPYAVEKFKEKPSEGCYEAAQRSTVKEYARVEQTLEDLKGCIAAGYPFVFGFSVYSDFKSEEVRTTGVMRYPPTGKLLGGHAVQACGYDDQRRMFIVRNSWGDKWGDKGYFYMPYEYISSPDLAHDFWAINFVNGADFPIKGAARRPQAPLPRNIDAPEDDFSAPVRAVHKLGWRRDLPDIRDRRLDILKHSKVRDGPLPAKVDLRPAECFEVYDQGDLGSCTANAIAAAFHFEQVRQGVKDFCPSRLFIYYNERSMEGHILEDTGASIRDGIVSINKLGVCSEEAWPYDVAKFATQPPAECYASAVLNTCKEYARVDQTLESLKACIAAGYPFVFGFAVFSDFYSVEVQTKGVMRFPPKGHFLGGHAVQACGYDDERQSFVVRNSWGAGWGDKGHFYIPYSYITHPKLCADFWAIKFVDGAEFPVKPSAFAQRRAPQAHFDVEAEDQLPRAFTVRFSMPVRTQRKFGWKRSLPSGRDRYLDVGAHSLVKGRDLPKKVDLRPAEAFDVYDQGDLGSCTANAIAAAFHFEQLRQGYKGFCPSRLFIYYNERTAEGNTYSDSGAYICDGIESLNTLGVCDEAQWPYDITQFTNKPPQECYEAAAKNTAKEYARVEQTLEALKGCIAAGYPFVFGFTVYSDIYSKEMQTTGVMRYPPCGRVLGGHAVQACGYDDDREVFIVRNSWGSDWGDKGHFYMPYAYMTNAELCDDFWAIKFVEQAEFPIKGTELAVATRALAPEVCLSPPLLGNRRFGWKRDLPDIRDRYLDVGAHSKVTGAELPPKADLRPGEGFPVYDQGDLGSCTANAIAAAFHFEQLRQGVVDFCPSRLFIYYNERAIEHTIGQDSGASLRDGILSLNKVGVCDEAMWPYNVDMFKEAPPATCYSAAKANTCKEYARVEQTLDSLKGCIAAGYPFVFGFAVFQDIYSPEVTTKGLMTFPPTGDFLGGHAVQACGYDDERKVFIVRNSWGSDWGDQGHFYMPYEYITHPQLAHDFWAIRFVEGAEFPVKPPNVPPAPPAELDDEAPRQKTFAALGGDFSIPVRTATSFGWLRSLTGIRDRYFAPAQHSAVRDATTLPEKVDLRPQEDFPVYDQGRLGSCTANAIAAAFEFEQRRQNLPSFTPSRLFIYYNERAMEDNTYEDAGAYIHDGIESLNKVGVCDEAQWPYVVASFKEKPPPECYDAAKSNIAKEYARVEQTLDDLKGCIAAGYPFVFGFTVYSDIYSKEMRTTGVMRYPPTGQVLGGHAVQACGYDDERKVFIVRNSWGDKWGDKGHFYMPYDYITNPDLADDFWAIKFVAGAEFPTKRGDELRAAPRSFSIPRWAPKRLGWRRDLPDLRDRFLDTRRDAAPLPVKVDLRPQEKFEVYDQGDLGSCTANALAAAYHFEQLRQGYADFAPSRLFIYYNERAIENSINEDAGASLRDGITTLNKLGVCSESKWPYDTTKFSEQPSADCYATAAQNVCKEYARVEQTLDDLRGCIAAGFPFVFGFAVFSDFFSVEVKTTGVMSFPPEGSFCGGHAVQACGYDDEKKVFIVRNSWGSDWGDKGHFYMPYEYITHKSLAADFWAIRFVDGVEFPTKSPSGNLKAYACEPELSEAAPKLPAFSIEFSVPTRITKRFGWRRGLPDIRDRYFDAALHSKVLGQPLPSAVDLRPNESFPVYNQGNLGSCTANAIAAAYHFEQLRQGLPDFNPSRLFIYYNERAMEDNTYEDAGAYIRDGIESLGALGVCDEKTWEYDITKFTEKPSADCYAGALKNKAKEYARVEQSLESLKACIAAGYPFVFGFTVYSDIYSKEMRTQGIMRYPPQGQVLGGHAVQACGYDDARQVFVVRNSWGEGWGDKGHFYMPYEYITNPDLCDDFWCIKFVESAEFPVTQTPTKLFSVPQANFAVPMRTTRKFGWKRSLPDIRDRYFDVRAVINVRNVPAKVDLRPSESFEVYDQGDLGSCTANAIAAAYHFEQLRQGVKDFCPSRLFIYYNERAMEDTKYEDAGAYIRDGIESLNKLGVCDEAAWPYDISKFTEQPPAGCYEAAKKYTAKQYGRVEQTLEELKACIAAGFPFVFGFSVYSDFYKPEVSKGTGPMNYPPEGECLGGHAVQACGYDDEKQVFIVRNSWGVEWGDKGHFYMPYAYITDASLCDDFWAIQFVEGELFPTKPSRHAPRALPPPQALPLRKPSDSKATRTTKRFGWKRDLPDIRDRYLDVSALRKVRDVVLPSQVDLRPAEDFPVYDQGDLGSCTANAIAAAFEFEQKRQKLNYFTPSRLFIYYNERAMEGTIQEDSGAMIRDGIMSLNKIGVCSEADWPYDIAKFAERPPEECYAAGVKNICKEYARVEQTLESLKGCLAAGLPFVFGFAVYDDIYSPEVQTTGVFRYPPSGACLGGHAVQACGYDDVRGCFIVRNSWGADWGDKGHFYMPYQYMVDPDLCSDFWAIKFVEGADFPVKAAHHATSAKRPIFLDAPQTEVFSVPQANFSIPVRTTRRLGWKRGLPSIHDRFLDVAALAKAEVVTLPAAVDLRPKENYEVYDQGDLGSCTANAIAAAYHFEHLRQGYTDFWPSRLFIYYNEREMEDTTYQDAGAYIRDGIESLNKLGVCSEQAWPYDIRKFTQKPSPECYEGARLNTAKDYARVEQTLDALRGCIAAGYPFVFGFSVYEDFYKAEVSAGTGPMSYPPVGECLGGHAVQACGYDDERKVFIVRNSWGVGWGDKGHFYMPYDYIVDPGLCDDFWAIKFVQAAPFPTKPRNVKRIMQTFLHSFHVLQAGISIPVRTTRRLGWKRDIPNPRARFFDVGAHSAVRGGLLPPAVDLRPKESFPVFDQGDLGSCTANAIAAAFQFEQLRQGLQPFTPSRLFIYYNERAMEDSVDQDAGAMISDGIASLNKIGVCSEDDWPYDVAKFTQKPSAACYEAATKNTAKEYGRVEQTLDNLKGCIAAGFPFVFGFAVYSDIYKSEVEKSGIMSYPPQGMCLGGHAVQACGYDDERKVFIVRNSWGEGWGDKGHFYMPYDYMVDKDLCSDFWAINFVEGAEFPTKASARR